jgi:hypothetical protein
MRCRDVARLGHWQWRLPLFLLLLATMLTDSAGAQSNQSKSPVPQSEAPPTADAAISMANKERAALVPLRVTKSDGSRSSAPPAIRIIVRPKQLGASGQVWLRATIVSEKPGLPVNVNSVPTDAPVAAAFRPLTIGKEEQFIVPLHGQQLNGNPTDRWAVVAIEPADDDSASQAFEIEVVSATLLQ